MGKIGPIVLVSACFALGTAGFASPPREDSVRQATNTYVGSLDDSDIYLIAVAADLTTAYKAEGQPVPSDDEQIMSVGKQLLQARLVPQPGGGWLPEPGALRDYPDDAYAGTQDRNAASPAKLATVTWDSSHGCRFPLFIRTWEDAAKGTTDEAYYQGLMSGLDYQFKTYVLQSPATSTGLFKLNNFLDGANGIYRKGYSGPKDPGNGPSGLSGTFLYGWWNFLDDPAVSADYAEEAANLPQDSDARVYDNIRVHDDEAWLICSLGSMMFDPSNSGNIDSHYQEVWNLRTKPRLQQDLWADSHPDFDPYYLMVPMHAAFWLNQPAWQQDCADQFARFSKIDPSQWKLKLLQKMYYLEFASRFAVLCLTTGQQSLLPSGLLSQLQGIVSGIWNGQPGLYVSNWGWGEPKYTAYRDYMNWKVSYPRYIPPNPSH